jgi:hypothetical protein
MEKSELWELYTETEEKTVVYYTYYKSSGEKKEAKGYGKDGKLSAYTAYLENGITDTREPFAQFKKLFFRSAKKVILAVDHTKFDKISFVKFGNINDVDIVVTDVEPSEKWKSFFENKNIKLYY